MKKLKLNKETISVLGNAGKKLIKGGDAVSTVYICANSAQECPSAQTCITKNNAFTCAHVNGCHSYPVEMYSSPAGPCTDGGGMGCKPPPMH